MIGLVDYDLWTRSSTSLYIPNLEIMKLASYYKLEENTFCQLISPTEENLEPFEKIFFFSEQNKIIIPEAFKKTKKVIYGGTAFTKGKYLPFENEIIDFTIPRTFIYRNFLQSKYQEGIKSKEINAFLDNTYYRAYAKENKLPIPPVLKRKKIILYDRDFFYPDWKEIISNLSERNPASIIRLHPIFCEKVNDFFDIRSFSKLARGNEIILDLKIPLEEIFILFNKYEKKFLAEINDSSNIFLPLGGNCKSTLKYLKNLSYTLNLLYSFWARGIPIKVKVIQPVLGETNPIFELSRLIENWTNLSTEVKKKKTILDRIKQKTKEQEQYDLFARYYPKEQDLFTQNFNSLKERRFWKI